MKKITYASMKLKVDTDTKSFNFNDNDFEVLKYLPIEDKYSLIMITIQKAFEDGIYNQFKLDMYFHLNLIYMYVANLTFTDKQREDENKLYDTLKSSGFMDKVIEAIPENEYTMLYDYLNKIVEDLVKYKNTFSAFVTTLSEDFSKNMQTATEIINNFDKEKYQNVIDFAKAANGGRDIK